MDQAAIESRLSQALIYTEAGKITRSMGLMYEAHLPGAAIGSICRIQASHDSKSEEGIEAEVVGFRDKRVMLMPFEETQGISNGSLVILKRKSSTVAVGDALLGRVLDGRGVAIDGKGPLFMDNHHEERSLYQKPTHPLEREMIQAPLD